MLVSSYQDFLESIIMLIMYRYYLQKRSLGPSIKYVRFRGWVGGTTKNVFLCTGVGGGHSYSVCTFLEKKYKYIDI